jgi:hypothetical protein
MKKVLISFVAVMATVAFINAQTVSVVSPSSVTTTYNNLQQAVDSAETGSILYLSGGMFGGATTTKTLTVIGVGSRHNTQNTDGNTTIGGSFTFSGDDASNSAIMGVYLQGNINLNAGVNNVLVRYCNVGSLVTSGGSNYCTVNQNIIRVGISANNWHNYITVTNNIIGDDIEHISNGVIEHNIMLDLGRINIVAYVNNSTFKNNIIKSSGWNNCNGSTITDNISNDSIGANCTKLEWNNIFAGGTPPTNVDNLEDFDFHLNGNHTGTDGTAIGIYGGTGWSETALPPVPYIMQKRVSEQTDETGKLKIQVRVKAQ